MKIDYTGKKILVTGGTKGIGKKLVEDFKKLRGEVYFTGRGNCNDKGFIRFDSDDMSTMPDILTFIDKMGFDVLVNNAGTNKIGNIEDYIDDDYERIINLNLTSCFKITKAVIRHMKKQQYGRIINITSISSEISMPLRSAYCSSKFGLLGLTKVSAVELSKFGILVNAIGPGVTKTELTKNVLGQKKMDEIAKNIPIGRLGEVGDISNVVMFVASNLNTYMVGQNILIDGGYTCI